MEKIVECFLVGCEWTCKVDMTDAETVAKSLPVGMGRLTFSIYKGEGNADEYIMTCCPEHTEKLIGKFKPRRSANAVEGSGEALRAAAAAVAAEKAKEGV